MNTQKSVAFHTLGCKLNFAETSTIARQFERIGFVKTDFEYPADVYVINTCSVTEEANRECRRIVRGALRNSPEAFVIVTGCYAQLKPEEIANIKGVDLVIGASKKFNVIDFIKEGQKKEKSEIHSCAIEDVETFNSAFSSGDRTRSFLKVQDGCDYNCSYCTIPMARGVSRSDSIENVVRNAEKLSAEGVKEIILSGVNVGDFGQKSEVRSQKSEVEQPENFLQLIKALDKIQAIARFRISSIEPNLLTDEMIEFVARSERFVPHFHIPLQSGSDKILKLMHRRYQRQLYADRVNKIKSLMPHCCIGVDVIVGFSGETEEDFLDTFNFIDSLGVSYLHVFTYSERDHTEAIAFKPVVPMEERKKRNRVLRNLSAMKQVNFYAENIGTRRTVLFERENKEGFMHGFTENYVKVKAKANSELWNEPIYVQLERIDADGTMVADCRLQITDFNSHNNLLHKESLTGQPATCNL
ncbi:MAG: tRNA (N(6)-L-threonylcarbamoyladenosine(37)-C(2))-methylthiotransferase MtaB [Bacteroidetes bacterium]|nr:MAG: tRNA (N(6)-L-threonylcarbamoyladenosine(37)-C(2))-methylthiotransferase MtaB [Bacteroidota bacterium]